MRGGKEARRRERREGREERRLAALTNEAFARGLES